MKFEEVVAFHGHVCPGLAMGFRVAESAVRELSFERSGDEELVAIVENNSCAVDAVQMVTGCTFGKGNLVFRDFGKQVYGFVRRQDGASLRISVVWSPPPESDEVAEAWQRYRAGDRSAEVTALVHNSKSKKVQAILRAEERELFRFSREPIEPPAKAGIFASVTCRRCGEKVMEPKTVKGADGAVLCIPCAS